jgi:phenylacetate-CoA ligase
MPQVGILELLDKAGNSTSLPGERGEMVVTGFNNPAFPLLRYRTGDVAIRGAEFCVCGRNYPLVERLEGRIQDYVVDKFGGLIPLAPAIFNYNDMDWRGVREFKVIQDEVGKILLNIQPEVELEADLAGAERRIASCMNAIFGERIKVTIRFVPEIARTAIGKLRYLEQNLDTTKYGAVP